MPSEKAENQELLERFEPLRVADVRDGMDYMGMHLFGSMQPSIRPLWRTRACGIARTCRYLPYEGPLPKIEPEEYKEWARMYYKEICPYPHMKEIQPGDFIVIDQSGVDAGLMGSANTLDGIKAGARGYVTNGGVRDTDEVILQKVPYWSTLCSQSMVQCRLRFDAKDIPVALGGVTVRPGDVIVADGDGVIVVPRKIATDVARYASRELQSDKKMRRRLYDDIGIQIDQTVAQDPENE